MEGLMERLERAVTRLEKMAMPMQASSGMPNGNSVNGIDGGKSELLYNLNQTFKSMRKKIIRII